MPPFNQTQISCWIIVCLTLVHAGVCNAQFTDNFSDGNFTVNPTWTAEVTEHWIVENGRLQSNVETTNVSFYISTPSSKAVNAQWQFFTNLKFNTSGSNFVDVYLVSANQNLLAAGNNGYFVRIGGTPDEISLYKITAGTPSILINGTDGVTNSSNNTFKIKVVRDPNNVWTLSYDDTGTGNAFVSEQPVTDNTFTTGNFFGIRVTQSTTTFAKQHFFDDFYVGDIITDTEPPSITAVTPVSSTMLNILFSEKVNVVSAEEESNYTVNHGVGHPQTAVLQPDGKTVQLIFVQEFANAVTSELTVVNVEDEHGNAIIAAVKDFFFYREVAAAYKDIIINEIFADPSPVISLPEAEFVELYNRSENVVNLNGWKLTDGSSTALLSGLLLPGAYRIITSSASVPLFTSFGTVLGVANFPTLNNSSDNLELRNADNLLIDKVSYTDSWYQDEDKKQGGYTLELIDPANPCGEGNNWIASESANGGTPGMQNSVFENKPDLTGPKLLSAVPVSEKSLLVTFDEKLESEKPLTTSFTIVPEVQLNDITFAEASLTALNVELNESLQEGTLYTLAVQNVYDCNGNEIQPEFSTVEFALPEPAEEGDILVNEILFNPRPTGVDFVELYNNSGKYINLKSWSLTNDKETLKNTKIITTQDILIKPHTYFVLTENRNVVKGEYTLAVEENIFVVKDLPSFNDDEGTVVLLNPDNEIIDFFSYRDDYHAVFLKDDEGVSLERISVSALTNDPSNWQSASSTVGYATPGYVNSNARSESLADKVKIDPEIFEPIHGQPSFAQIHYNFTLPGYVANVKILDHRGREVKVIANNVTLGTTGFFRWDGDMTDGSKARTGYYIVWMEVFHANGKVETFRKKVIVTSRF